MMTVILSIFAHGLSAIPEMEIYARKISGLSPGVSELEGMEPDDVEQNALTVHQPNQ